MADRFLKHKKHWCQVVLVEEEANRQAECLGCRNYFQLDEMHPVLDEDWVCKVCFRNELEGIS